MDSYESQQRSSGWIGAAFPEHKHLDPGGSGQYDLCSGRIQLTVDRRDMRRFSALILENIPEVTLGL
jgi:hypothetical protein